MSATVEHDLDIDALEADARARLAVLEEQQMRLAPEALVDPEVAAELRTVTGQIRECREVIDNAELGRRELTRRERQAQADAEAEHRAAAFERARELQAEREKLAAAVDKSAAEMAKALRAWDRCTSHQEAALRAAGRPQQADQARPRPWMPETAIQRALIDAGVPHGLIRMETFTGSVASVRPAAVRPLVECDARPLEPVEA